MTEITSRSWIAIDGTLETIDFAGAADDRFPAELAEIVLGAFSRPGDWVLDPFAGLGTTVHAAQQLGRRAIGFERDPARAEWARRGLVAPNTIIQASIETIGEHALPRFNLVFTSPPYVTVELEDDPWGPSYFEDMERIFSTIADRLAPEATVVVEVSNINVGGFRPLVGQMAEALSKCLRLQREIARINTGATPAGPGLDHSALLVFSARN